jgi:hypothetical protein
VAPLQLRSKIDFIPSLQLSKPDKFLMKSGHRSYTKSLSPPARSEPLTVLEKELIQVLLANRGCTIKTQYLRLSGMAAAAAGTLLRLQRLVDPGPGLPL